jgi:hypothetical protein
MIQANSGSVAPADQDYALVPTASAPLYVRILGDAWSQIAEPIRRVHSSGSTLRASGCLRVEHGSNGLSRALARLLRLPRPAPAAETRLTVTSGPDGEQWRREFDGRRFETRQSEAGALLLAERFGVLEFRFRLDTSCGDLRYVQREVAIIFGPVRWRLPAVCSPRVEARESPATPTSIRIAVRAGLPGVGLLIAYDGVVHIEDPYA